MGLCLTSLDVYHQRVLTPDLGRCIISVQEAGTPKGLSRHSETLGKQGHPKEEGRDWFFHMGSRTIKKAATSGAVMEDRHGRQELVDIIDIVRGKGNSFDFNISTFNEVGS